MLLHALSFALSIVLLSCAPKKEETNRNPNAKKYWITLGMDMTKPENNKHSSNEETKSRKQTIGIKGCDSNKTSSRKIVNPMPVDALPSPPPPHGIAVVVHVVVVDCDGGGGLPGCCIHLSFFRSHPCLGVPKICSLSVTRPDRTSHSVYYAAACSVDTPLLRQM